MYGKQRRGDTREKRGLVLNAMQTSWRQCKADFFEELICRWSEITGHCVSLRKRGLNGPKTPSRKRTVSTSHHETSRETQTNIMY
jgi:hypothetical protein